MLSVMALLAVLKQADARHSGGQPPISQTVGSDYQGAFGVPPQPLAPNSPLELTLDDLTEHETSQLARVGKPVETQRAGAERHTVVG